MNSQEFRAAPELVAEAKKILSSAAFRAMLLVLETEAPHRKPVNSTLFESLIVNNETISSIQLGRISGYEEAVKLLKTLEIPFEKPSDTHIEPTYTDSTPAEEQHGN